ncbi:hypothetical protein FSP39_021712 [Pinctada imbricata]|uniref:Protein kinase domain-containing protein n=1 Tax=Pinctada imbricata TaxID=66713 RepID=A0AA88Y675_PINIB|nr:hypothetical protein FSP39_021712 [Pinctada imbricata]
MKVVCVVDSWGRTVGASGDPRTVTVNQGGLVEHRANALGVIKKVCDSLDAELENVPFQKLDFGETLVLDMFYNADAVIVDMSIPVQQSALFYHIGVRQSMEMKNNIILFYDTDPEQSVALRLSCGTGVAFFPYLVDENCTCVIVTDSTLPKDACTHPERGQSLHNQLKKKLNDMDVENRVHIKERFLNDLRKAREQYSGADLNKVLEAMRTRLDDPQLLSVEVILNMLISFREIQNYHAMVKLVEDLQQIPNNKIPSKDCVMYLYAFALNRRNKNGDRKKALTVISEAIQQTENPAPDMLCLCGRIYKDLYVDSEYTDNSLLQNAIEWYRKGFERQPNEYAGINLATLLVVSGKEFSNCMELQRIGLVLNNLIGKKGSLQSLRDYWDVATFFEISVLAQDYGKAIQAAECMFLLEPPNWYLKSTVNNITLIMRFRKKPANVQSREEQLFYFWIEFFLEACKCDAKELTSSRFPVLILEPTKEYFPSYIQVNYDEDTKEVRLWHVYQKKGNKLPMEWTYPASSIKGVSLYKRDCRAVFVYVQENSDDFHIFFSSELQRKSFYDMVSSMIRYQVDSQVFSESVDDSETVEFEYEYDEKQNRMVLGRGTYGIVYAARDLKTQVRIAVKEVPEKQTQEVQPLHEEIKLHSRLSHRNIVKYLGSVSEDGYFKIFMEQVPGGSLSQLLLSKWGPLKDNETTIAYYTKQILDGLKYLHDNKIVHRDIKGDNVLVNTYSGVLKISDFGTSKRLSGINPCADTFAGTIQYMAPEVIDKGVRGYGPPADIWSLGCTVIEMATGKIPFIELGSPEAAMFKVGFYKMHPEIPSTMSEKAKEFLLRSFEPEPSNRATAEELLKHPFIVDTLSSKRRKKKVPDVEYLRSTSMPSGHENVSQRPQLKLHIPKKNKKSTHTHSHTFNREVRSPASSTGSNDTMDLDDMDCFEDEKDASEPKYHRSRSLHSGLVHLDATDRRFGLDFMFRKRADSDSKYIHKKCNMETGSSSISSSSMMNLSPDTADGDHGTHDSGQGGFYLLRKDSERRTTLVHILTKDMEKICETWLDFLHKDATISNPKLTTEHLRWLLVSLKAYITDPINRGVVKDTLDRLRMEVEFDATALMEIQLALYVFHEAVSKHLKSHSIQPHWMFALDNLLRGAVQEAITILSPELGANLAGAENKEEEVGTSGVPSTTSGKSAILYRSQAVSELQTQLETAQMENVQLLQQLVEVNRLYGNLLRRTIEERKLQAENLQ